MFLDFGWDYQTVERDEAGNVVAGNEEGDPSIIYLPVADMGYGGRRCAGGGDPAPIPPNKPWTITYTVDALHGSRDDFSPAGMFFDCPSKDSVGGLDNFEDGTTDKACPAPDEDLGERSVQWSKKYRPALRWIRSSFRWRMARARSSRCRRRCTTSSPAPSGMFVTKDS